MKRLVANALFTLGLEFARTALPLVQPDTKAVFLHKLASEGLDPVRVVVLMAEEEVELLRMLRGGDLRGHEERRQPRVDKVEGGTSRKAQPCDPVGPYSIQRARLAFRAFRPSATAWPTVAPRTSSR